MNIDTFIKKVRERGNQVAANLFDQFQAQSQNLSDLRDCIQEEYDLRESRHKSLSNTKGFDLVAYSENWSTMMAMKSALLVLDDT